MINNPPIISVIVPIYQVEKYLDECIKSISNQTYPYLEIILIDDGSTDNCGAMCNQYALQDKRIRVIHQNNQGLSAARNRGLDIATGKYISFIDSDDYISPYFYEYLLNAIETHPEARIVGCQYYKDEDGEIIKPDTKCDIKEPTLYSYHHFCEDALLGNLSIVVWNKLYDASLLKDIRFREGRIYEDSLFMYDFSFIVKQHQANFLLLPDYLYYYRIRQGSICHRADPILNKLEYIRARKEIAASCRKHSLNLHQNIQEKIHHYILSLYIQILTNKEWRKKYVVYITPYVRTIDTKEILHYDIPIRNKTVFLIAKYSPSIYLILRKIKKKFF